jgi:uncharacterized protein (TIGR02271 family)
MTTTKQTPIQTGWDVIGSDDQTLGSVAEVGPNYVRVEKGLIFVKDIYVPVSAISDVNPAEHAVWLNVPKDQVESMGWDNLPTQGSWDDWSSASGAATDKDWSVGRETRGDFDTTTSSDRQRLQVHEEQLEARTNARQAGEVEITKDVVEEQRTIQVPVAREEVHVRRTAANRDATASDGAFTEGDTIRVPVMEEEVEITKRPRVVEEVEVEKTARQDTEHATGTVRKEQVNVTGEGAVHRK